MNSLKRVRSGRRSTIDAMKHDTVYNKSDNAVMVRTRGNEIHVICDTEDKVDGVVERMSTPNCFLAGYEEWDEGPDKRWILTFLVGDSDMVISPELN